MTAKAPADIVQAQATKAIVTILLGWQLAVLAVGSTGAFYPARSDTWLRLLLVSAVILSLLLTAVLITGDLAPLTPLAAAYGLTAISLGVVFHILERAAEWPVLFDNVLRLYLPLLIALGTTSQRCSYAELAKELRRRVYVLDAAAAMTICVVIVSRAGGFSGSWLSGDPLVAFIAFPVVFEEDDVDLRRLFLYGGAIALSGKRWAQLCWLTVILLRLLLVRRKRGRVLAGAATSCVLLAYLFSSAGLLAPVLARGETSGAILREARVSDATSLSLNDGSAGQRIEELRLETEAWRASASAVVLGRPLTAESLRNGVDTHAIHNTLVFLLARGGLVWIFALVAVRGQTRTRHRFFLLASILVFLESAAGNSALDPTFGLALGVLIARRK